MYLRIRKKLLVGVTLLALAAVFFRYAGIILVAEDFPEKADLIVVLMGSGPDRILGAVDLYREGYAPCILMVENWEPGYELLASLGVKVPRDVEIEAMIGTQLGVPKEAFIILPGDAKSTQEEAQIISRYLQDNPHIDKILLVSSKYHSRRSAIVFCWAIEDVEIISCPTPYDNFNAESWWRTRQDAKWVIMEYAKLANFYILDRWR